MKRPGHNARLAPEHGARQVDDGDGLAPLRRLFLFRTWKDDDLKPLAQRGRFTTHRKGDILFRAGEECDRLLVLVEGQIEMFRDQQGRRVPLHTVRGQALIACAALFLDQCFPASAMVVPSAIATIVMWRIAAPKSGRGGGSKCLRRRTSATHSASAR